MLLTPLLLLLVLLMAAAGHCVGPVPSQPCHYNWIDLPSPSSPYSLFPYWTPPANLTTSCHGVHVARPQVYSRQLSCLSRWVSFNKSAYTAENDPAGDGSSSNGSCTRKMSFRRLHPSSPHTPACLWLCDCLLWHWPNLACFVACLLQLQVYVATAYIHRWQPEPLVVGTRLMTSYGVTLQCFHQFTAKALPW